MRAHANKALHTVHVLSQVPVYVSLLGVVAT